MPRGVAAEKVVTEFPADPGPLPMSNGCAQVDALDRQTAAVAALTTEIQACRAELVTELQETRAAFKPAVDAVADLGSAQKKLCNFLVKNRLKIATGLVGALVAVGAISPNAAQAVGGLLKLWGLAS